jgi:uroporphyrinogen-III synthase
VHVVVTREVGHNETLRSWLPPDATVSEVPLTTTNYRDVEEVRAAVESTASFGLFFVRVLTSARSARYRDVALSALAPDAIVLSVGSATAREGDVTGEGGAAGLASHIETGPVLFVGASAPRAELPSLLRDRGIDVTMMACYDTVAATMSSADEAALRDADVVVIGAPSAWVVAAPFINERAWVVVPGATTAASVRATHDRVLEGWGPQLRELLTAL